MTRAVLLTRFNVLTGYSNGHQRLERNWLDRRIGLFRRICAPSVAAQSTDAFDWLVFIDAETDASVIREIQDIAPGATMVPVDELFTGETAAMAIREHTTKSGRVVTLRLDCDDAISRGFVEEVALAASQHITGTWLQILSGYQYVGGSFLRSRWHSNPFVARIEDIGDLNSTTALGANHASVENKHSLATIRSDEFWVQSIHTLNTARGSLPRGYLANSTSILARLAWPPSDHGTTLDRRTAIMAALRETGRRAKSLTRSRRWNKKGTR